MVVCESGMPAFDFPEVRCRLIPYGCGRPSARSAIAPQCSLRSMHPKLCPLETSRRWVRRGMMWLATCGQHLTAVPTEQEMDSLLVNNEMFALRCAASPGSFFFGPTKELLRTSACRLRVRRNVGRLRRCAHWTGRIACWYKRARERLYAPGGLGFAVAHGRVPCPFLMRLIPPWL